MSGSVARISRNEFYDIVNYYGLEGPFDDSGDDSNMVYEDYKNERGEVVAWITYGIEGTYYRTTLSMD